LKESRPNSAARGYGHIWRMRQAEHLERVRKQQEAEGRPDGPWCQCEECSPPLLKVAGGKELPSLGGSCLVLPRVEVTIISYVSANAEKADTVDHIRKRRTFPLELQGSDQPGGSDHPSNLRAMSHSHHSRRSDDKAARRVE
jgi:hypothetical protein